MPNQPVPLHGSRSDLHETEISGRLYQMAEEVKANLADDADLDHVISLGITLLHSAIGRDISVTDGRSGEEEVYRLWR